MRRFTLLVLLFASLPYRAALAASSDWYQVELLVFAQTQPDKDEHWNPDLMPRYDNQAIHPGSGAVALPAAADTTARQAANAGAWRLLPEDASQPVAGMARKMNASGSYRTLYYERWQQPLLANRPVLPIFVQGGRLLAGNTPAALPQPMDANLADNTPAGAATANLPELQGTITLSRAQFVHVTPNLWFAFADNGQTRFTTIKEARRLKNGELHYIDNARFGMLIRVTPLNH